MTFKVFAVPASDGLAGTGIGFRSHSGFKICLLFTAYCIMARQYLLFSNQVIICRSGHLDKNLLNVNTIIVRREPIFTIIIG